MSVFVCRWMTVGFVQICVGTNELAPRGGGRGVAQWAWTGVGGVQCDSHNPSRLKQDMAYRVVAHLNMS